MDSKTDRVLFVHFEISARIDLENILFQTTDSFNFS